MCGIFGIFNRTGVKITPVLQNAFNSSRHRGPDRSVLKMMNNNICFGFHHLSIIGDDNSAQPIRLGSTVMVCNGEIFNYKELIKEHNIKMNTTSDCEVIVHLYKRYGIHKTLDMLDAEFSFILYDEKYNKLYTARDIYGVRPLFIGYVDGYINQVSSEMKSINDLSDYITQHPPGCFYEIDMNNNKQRFNQYHDYKYKNLLFPNMNDNEPVEVIYNNIKKLLNTGVEKRLMSDRDVGFLLSGGLDSSLITSIASRYIDNQTCFSIGLKDSVDVENSKKVSDYLNIKDHHIIEFDKDYGFDIIPSIIYSLETYDVTTIRASVPQYIMAKYIKDNTDVKVLLSGEGADELFAGYQYNWNAPHTNSLYYDSIRLLKELCYFDNLRTDRTMAAHGLEVRVPFLDKHLVNYVMNLPDYLRMPTTYNIEKGLLRHSYSDNYLPNDILMRSKEAFSDAVSSRDISWYKSIQNRIDLIITDSEFERERNIYMNRPLSKEAYYYRKIYESIFPNRYNIIPHYWMPRWQDGTITDPSATVLKCSSSELSNI